MEENKFSPDLPDDDFSLEEQFKPIEIDESKAMQNMQNMQSTQTGKGGKLGGGSPAVARAMKIGTVATAIGLMISMFLPYLTIEVPGFDMKQTSCLFPGLYAIEFLIIAIVMLVVVLKTDNEKALVIDAVASIIVCIRAASRASYGSFAVNMSVANSGFKLDMQYGIGFYGMIICSVGMAVCAAGYLMTTEIKKPF